MSVPKITSKNLSFNSALPPFLQRLHNANVSSQDGRHERAIARPKRARDTDADAEDEPAYVDETTNHTLSREEYAAFVAAPDSVEQEQPSSSGGPDTTPGKDNSTAKEAAISIGAVRKRKAVKVIEEDASDAEDAKDKPPKTNPTQAKGSITDTSKGGKVGTAVAAEPTKLPKPTGKKKKIKLSFGDDD